MGIYIPNMNKPKDGLYNIKDGKIYKYRAKGGTVRTYDLINIPTELDIKMLKNEAEMLGCVVLTREEFEAYEKAYVLQAIRKGE